MCWRKNGSGIELEPKKPGKAHLAGDREEPGKAAQIPAGEGKLLLGMGEGGQDGGCGHLYLADSLHQLDQCDDSPHPSQA